MKWLIGKKLMETERDGVEILLDEGSEISNLIQGGRTDHIHLAMQLPKEFTLTAGHKYYLGVTIHETYEPYGLQIEMTCNAITQTHAYFEVDKPDQDIYELQLC